MQKQFDPEFELNSLILYFQALFNSCFITDNIKSQKKTRIHADQKQIHFQRKDYESAVEVGQHFVYRTKKNIDKLRGPNRLIYNHCFVTELIVKDTSKSTYIISGE